MREGIDMKKEVISNRDLKSKQTKESLFKAVGTLYKKNGCEYLTVRNICEEAKVSIGSFYHHYENKDDLIVNFFYEGYKRFLKKSNFSNSNEISKVITEICINYGTYCESLGVEFITYTTRSKETNNSLFIDEHIPGFPKEDDIRKGFDLIVNSNKLKTDVSFDEMVYDICLLRRAVLMEWCFRNGNCDIEKLMKKFCGIYLKGVFN